MNAAFLKALRQMVRDEMSAYTTANDQPLGVYLDGATGSKPLPFLVIDAGVSQFVAVAGGALEDVRIGITYHCTRKDPEIELAYDRLDQLAKRFVDIGGEAARYRTDDDAYIAELAEYEAGMRPDKPDAPVPSTYTLPNVQNSPLMPSDLEQEQSSEDRFALRLTLIARRSLT